MAHPRIVFIAVALVSGIAAAAAYSARDHGIAPLSSGLDAIASAVFAPGASVDASDFGSSDRTTAQVDAATPHRQAAPLSKAQLGAPLVNGKFLSACGAPDDMKVVVRAVITKGRANDVAVVTTPSNGAIAGCVERSVRGFQWDISPKPGRVTVSY